MALRVNDTSDTATGIGMVIYQASQPSGCVRDSVLVNYGLSYFSISPSLNVLLTLMIVIRLVLHIRNIRTAMEAPSGFTGLYKTVLTMLIESSAIFAVSSLLSLGFWGSGSYVADVFSAIQAKTQVRAFFPAHGGLRTWLSDVTAGHRSIAHHSTGCQSEGVDEQKCCHWKY